MEKLFEIETPYSYDEYLELNKFHSKNSKKSLRILTFICIAFIYIVSIALLILGEDIIIPIVYILFATLLLGIVKFMPIIVTKRIAKSDKLINNIVNDISFYNEYIETVSEKSSFKVNYNEIYNIYETNTHIYIYINKMSVIMINKNGFKVGNLEDLRIFLQERVKDKYVIKFKI